MAGAENGGEQHDDGVGDNLGGDPLGSCSGEQHDDVGDNLGGDPLGSCSGEQHDDDDGGHGGEFVGLCRSFISVQLCCW